MAASQHTGPAAPQGDVARDLCAGFYAELQETSRADNKGEAQAATPRGESTEAAHWDGSTRMSVEDPVTGSEQRGRVRWLHRYATGNRRKWCVQPNVSLTR
jgi:hypothetical protein